MKKFFLLPLIIFGLTANATDYYISNTGNNSNTGTSSSPWLTLAYASNHAKISGDIIHVNAGSYLETSQSVLAVGVSIEGAGPNLIIKYSISTATTYGILLNSAEGTNGNQHISNLQFDGDNLTTYG